MIFVSEQAQKKVFPKGHPLLGNHAQQPFEVVPSSAQHRMQPVAGFPLEVTAIHAVILLQVPDDGLDRMSALEHSFVAG